MIDSSDGAATDLAHLCRASGVGIDLELRDLCVDGITEADVLAGGEDHSFLATVPAATVLPEGVRIIGRVVEGARVRVDGREVGSGWEHHRGS
jgi:thiamine-monophosphate kinase